VEVVGHEDRREREIEKSLNQPITIDFKDIRCAT